MSELINNSNDKKELLKHMLKELHSGQAPEFVKLKVAQLMSSIPYNDVVEVEQQLISEGISPEEITKFCDLHSMVLEGKIEQHPFSGLPASHPVDTFLKENEAVKIHTKALKELFVSLKTDDGVFTELINSIRLNFNRLMDIDKHYKRKEYLVFPFLEKNGITGPPKVMWGKHDEIREKLTAAISALSSGEITKEDVAPLIELLFLPAVNSVDDMIVKEEEILLPMCLDKLTIQDWYEIYQQTNEFGYCLYDPILPWKPENVLEIESDHDATEVKLPSGKLDQEELLALLNTLPVDITFVDKNDKVKYFSQGKHRIFDRNRAILGRDVRLCHPPSSVNIVEQILEDFKNGRENHAPFWIQMKGQFIHIEYFALKNEKGEYLGTLEVSQNLTELRKLEGDQRLLNYKKEQ